MARTVEIDVKIKKRRIRRKIDDVQNTLMGKVTTAVYKLFVSAVERNAKSRHSTAQHFGAKPTGHWDPTKVKKSNTEKEGLVQVFIEGAQRAYDNLYISPKRVQALTIPISAIAYGHRAADVKASGWTLFSKKGILWGRRDEDKQPTALYYLAAGAFQHQDQSLLPRTSDITQAAQRAIGAFLKRR